MPRFAANLTLLFTEHPFAERFAAARRAGFDAVEMLFPFDFPARDLRDLLDENKLELVLFNTPSGNWDSGERGFAAVPREVSQFRTGFERALAYADVVRPRMLHVLAGIAAGPDARRVFLKNLSWAVGQADQHQLTIEPINAQDMPGYFLNDFDMAAGILDDVGADNLGLQFDAYHAQKITGDVMAAWARHGHRARHVQVAAVEGRHEPVAGVIDYPAFFARLDAEGYAGFVSGEYLPRGRTDDGLGWIR